MSNSVKVFTYKRYARSVNCCTCKTEDMWALVIMSCDPNEKQSVICERKLWNQRRYSASIRILYMYITSSDDTRYDNRSYAVVVQRRRCVRRQISPPSFPSCVHANDLSFKICVFRVVKGPHSCRDRCYCSVGMWEHCKSRVQLQGSEIGEIQAPIAHERRVLSRPELKICFCAFWKSSHDGWHPH